MRIRFSVHTGVARCFGAVWLFISVGVTIWLSFAAETINFNLAAVLGFMSVALSLVASYVLLFSKQFATEFVRPEPNYKHVLKRPVILLVILVFLIAMLNDMYHLFSFE
jgi:hypothetical protein